jgi:antitoxin component YwqK of YwqJK toxin-antitoxin module
MKSLVLVDSIEIKECFKNGKLKETGLIKYYKHGDFVYEMKVGVYTRYYKDGSKSLYYNDDWGTELLAHHYDSEDNLIMERTTTKIETTAADLDEFLNSTNHITYYTEFKDYVFDYKLCKYYLKKTGQYSNGKKIGVWQYFYPSGDLKKEKQH